MIPKFDLQIIDNENSLNVRAQTIRNNAWTDKLWKVEEMVMAWNSSHAVPGHDDIAAHRQSEEQTIDCSPEIIEILYSIFSKLEKESSSVSCN